MFRQTSPPVPAFSETVRVNHFDAQSCSDILGLCIHYLDPDDEVRTAAEPRIVHGPETFDPAYRQTTLALRRKVQLGYQTGVLGFNLFYYLKCAVATGHPTVERTEVATLQSGAELEKSKRHQV
ncbi:hypothetical protein MGG_10968 [Pyricularia oryzae 70-15]|uniref:Uncharacterized protein n=3 Tax=Pyricularia oryzae TaxID=318829 RepID=G4MXH0_PYRO7|nr:uncharacterized protein MGG_10968 [Pyricularia oryzae 70-15]EHA53500.1 hypothetical protein MGG_10968 [Pyricularia oryzae 70-15]ELQ33306.1 hypothetical protein OOU_Y34scaffold00973g2 [Pyricularia oryzae Y34]